MKSLRKVLCSILAICLFATALPVTALAADDYAGKTVVIVTGNMRGHIGFLPQIAAVRADFEARGADVVLADTGEFLHGSVYSAFNSGSTMITLMIAAGYDIVALGTYDFAFGTGTLGTAFHGDAVEFGPLGDLLEANPALVAVASNIIGQNDYFHSFVPNTTITTASGLDIGFFGLIWSHLAENMILESNLAGLQFADATDTAIAQIVELADADFTIGLSNGPVMVFPDDYTLRDNAVVHTSIGAVLPGEMTISAIVIDNETMEHTTRSINLADFAPHPEVAASVDEFKAVVDAAFSQVARSVIALDGSTIRNRSGETNLGNFWADALRWFAISGEINAHFDEDDVAVGNDRIHVSDENVVALWNAGNLRDWLYSGDVTTQDLRRILPFPNTVAVVYLTGAELLEQLEASSQGLPFSDETFALTASLMHVSGIEYTINQSIPFNAGEAHLGRIWHRAASVERVTITSINGNPFDETAIYAVITSNANFNGMDISYVMAERVSDTQNRSTITTARVVDDAVMGYILSLPDATIGLQHTMPDGRLTVTVAETAIALPGAIRSNAYTDIAPSDWFYTLVNFVAEAGLMGGINGLFSPDQLMTRGEFAEILHEISGDFPIAGHPDEYLTRQELAVFVFQHFGSPDTEGSLSFADAADIAYWAYEAVVFCFESGIMQGISDTIFAPNQPVTRAMGATVLARMLGE